MKLKGGRRKNEKDNQKILKSMFFNSITYSLRKQFSDCVGFKCRYDFKSAVHCIRTDIDDCKLFCVGGRVNMILFIILKIVTTAVMAFFAIASALYAPKKKKASDGIILFAFAMFLAFGITFMWV